MLLANGTETAAARDSGVLAARVLVVDDHVELCDAIVAELVKAGYETHGVYSGEAALATMTTFEPDVLVTDERMPGMTGLAVVDRARGIDPRLAAVMLTGHATVQHAVVAMRSGVDDYLAKPVSPVELLAAVRRVLVVRNSASSEPRISTTSVTLDGTPAVPGSTFAQIERHAILTTYEACGRNAMRTAETLGLSPRTIHYRLREYRGAPGRRKHTRAA